MIENLDAMTRLTESLKNGGCIRRPFFLLSLVSVFAASAGAAEPAPRAVRIGTGSGETGDVIGPKARFFVQGRSRWEVSFAHAEIAGHSMGEVQHVTVAREAGRFLGWPANHGLLWAWGDELLVGFTSAAFAHNGPDRHAYDPSKPMDVALARSPDGGRTWSMDKPAALRGHKNRSASPIVDPKGDIRSDNPNLILLVGYEDEDRSTSWFQVSPDRGRTWGPRQALPDVGLGPVCGRTDYLIYTYAGSPFTFRHNIVRFNISENDCRKVPMGAIHVVNDGDGVLRHGHS